MRTILTQLVAYLRQSQLKAPLVKPLEVKKSEMAISDSEIAAEISLPSDALRLAQEIGLRHGVSGALHPRDYIFWYVYNDPSQPDKRQAIEHYFESGRGTAAFLGEMLNEPRIKSALAGRYALTQPLSILEFASGYGRVTRHFPMIIPETTVLACDIHTDAVTFLRSIGLQACLSSSIPEQLNTGRTFDVIFVLSFFTHMPRSTWARWLGSLANQLAPNGVLIFSAHGEISQALMGVSQLEADGFYFTPSSEQKDLHPDEYGNTVTTFGFVYNQCIASNLKLLQFKQAGIAHHDVYVVQRYSAH
jgi:SAM-dependent methyltransferase